ncbi:hypothetical protein ANMWB30_07060 [Arthrobacter sp. MWB30]|nr:hypothetical protein ANMWB30_07060 [Arthrobacter sp. MWB30]
MLPNQRLPQKSRNATHVGPQFCSEVGVLMGSVNHGYIPSGSGLARTLRWIL